MSSPKRRKSKVSLTLGSGGPLSPSPSDNLFDQNKLRQQRRVSWMASDDSLLTPELNDGGDTRRFLNFEISQWPSQDPIVNKRRSSLRLKRKTSGGGSNSSGSKLSSWKYCCGFGRPKPIDGMVDGRVCNIKNKNLLPIDCLTYYYGNIKPSNPAVQASEGIQAHTFEELNWASDEIAKLIKPIVEEQLKVNYKDVTDDSGYEPCIGIMRNPCEKCMVGILAIWKLGFPYLPIRKYENPTWRVAEIVKAMRPLLLIGFGTTAPKELEEATRDVCNYVGFEGLWKLIEEKQSHKKTPLTEKDRKSRLRISLLQDINILRGDFEHSNRIISIYYRFSGDGKIVPSYIRNITLWNRIHEEWNNFPFEKNETVGVYAPIDSHEFLGQVLAPLLAGNPIVIIDPHDFYGFLVTIQKWKLKRLVLFPELLRAMVNVMELLVLLKNNQTMSSDHQLGIFDSVKYWFCTGAGVRRELAVSFFTRAPKKSKLINLYGNRELLSFVCYEVFTSIKDVKYGYYYDVIPMGRPAMNTRLYILDVSEKITGNSGLGEIYIAGPGVFFTPAYLRGSDNPYPGLSPGPVTIPNVFLEEEKSEKRKENYEKLLKTNDFGRLVYSDKRRQCKCCCATPVTLQFAGNAEGEVIIENYRVNTNEIVMHLKEFPGVKGCHVMVYRPGTLSRALLAFIVTSMNNPVSKEKLHVHLRSKIPEYEIPNLIIIPNLPIKNYKLNKALLVEQYQMDRMGKFKFSVNSENMDMQREEQGTLEMRVAETLFQILYHSCSVAEDWSLHHLDYTLTELRIHFTFLPSIYRELLRHGYNIEMQEFFQANKLSDILKMMIKACPPPALEIALELIQMRNMYAVELITHKHKNEIIRFFVQSSCGLENPNSLAFYSGFRNKDVEETLIGIWPLLVYKRYSIAIRNKKTKKIVCALLNADCRDKAYCQQWQAATRLHPIKYRLEIIDSMDDNLTLNHLINPRFPLHGLESVFFIADFKMLTNYEKSIQVLELLFTQAIQTAKSAGFKTMHMIIYDYVFSNFACEAFNFKVVEMKQANMFEARDGTKPYHLAPDIICGYVLYKTL